MIANPWPGMLELLRRHVPKIEAEIEGASAQQVEQLGRAHGYPLPELYQQYLRAMGNNPGDLLLVPHLDPSIDALLERLPEAHPQTYPPARFLRIGLDDGGAGLSEIYDLYLDLDDCHGADCRLVELEYYDDDDDPDPYEPGDETVHGLDLSSLGVSRAVQLALLSQHDTETMRTVAVAARDEAKTPSVLAALAGLGQRRGMTPILAAAPRALAVGQGDTVWLATHPRERRCLLRIGAADPNALKAELAILDDYLVLEDTTL